MLSSSDALVCLYGERGWERKCLRQRACILRVDFHPLLIKTLPHYCRQEGEGKQQILRFINHLVKRGYRHFILSIEQPSDVWIAEVVAYYALSNRDGGIRYTIGLWRYDERPCDWIESLPFDWDFIVKNAYRVFLRSDNWYDKSYRMERIYIPIRDK